MPRIPLRLVTALYPLSFLVAVSAWHLLGHPNNLLTIFLFIQNTVLVVVLLHTKTRVDVLYDEVPEDDDTDDPDPTPAPGTTQTKPRPHQQWNEDML